MSRQSAGMPIDVEIITTGDPGDPFTHQWKMRNGSEWKTGNIEVPQGADHDLHFSIRDDAQIGARFQNTAAAAFGANRGNACPGAGANGGGEIDFQSSKVIQQGLGLHIRDRNHQPDKLKYALFFDSSVGPLAYDPIIENKGGGPPLADDIR